MLSVTSSRLGNPESMNVTRTVPGVNVMTSGRVLILASGLIAPGPEAPGAPGSPGAPSSPAGPDGPRSPSSPSEPAGPAAPGAPCVPISPAGPVQAPITRARTAINTKTVPVAFPLNTRCVPLTRFLQHREIWPNRGRHNGRRRHHDRHERKAVSISFGLKLCLAARCSTGEQLPPSIVSELSLRRRRIMANERLHGEVAERIKASLSKSGVSSRGPRVRIPPSPPRRGAGVAEQARLESV